MTHHVRRYAYLSIATALLTMAMKFGAYLLTGSVGLFSDAVESVVNLTAGLIALLAIIHAARPADGAHSYGHGKVEYFSSGAEGVLICLAALGIAVTSVQRFLSPVAVQSLGLGLFVALLAGFLNLLTALIMLKGAKKYDSIVLEADARHLLTDVWTSAGLAVALGMMLFAPPSWWIVDPILGMLMAGHIAWAGIGIIRRSVGGLLDVRLPDDEVREIARIFGKHLKPPCRFHALRTRKSGVVRFVDVHLLVPGETSVAASHELCVLLEDALREKWPQMQVTIHVEPLEDEASFDCEDVGGLCEEHIATFS